MPPAAFARLSVVTIAIAFAPSLSGEHQDVPRFRSGIDLISDGRDTRSVVSLREVRQAILESDVLVYALGIGRLASTRGSANENVHADALRQLTDETGGRTEVVRSMSGLDKAIERLADDLRYQYLLGYSSNLAKNGRWRSIRVEVRDRGLRVRARRGYLAP